MWRFLYDRSVDGSYEPGQDRERLTEEIRRLAASYVPEWKFRTDDPDIGSVIALIFAVQMEEAVRKARMLPFMGLKELVDMLDLKPRKPTPARTVLVFDVDAAGQDGIRIEKESRFLCTDRADGPPVSFRTEQDLLAVYAKLTDVLEISEEKRKVTSHPPGTTQISMFECKGCNLFEEWLEVRHWLLPNGTVRLFDHQEKTACSIENVSVRAFGRQIGPQFLYDGNREIEAERAAIFGEEIAPYKECYIGQEDVFSKVGAGIILSFELEWKVCHTGISKETKEVLKPVMKRKPKSEKGPAVHVHPQEISISYYNGKGFKQLCPPEKAEVLTKVTGRRRQCSFRFLCPDDWQLLHVGAYDARCLRFRVEKAANSYQPDVISHYPVLKNIRFSYSYGHEGVRPEGVIRHRGALHEDLRENLIRGEEPELFPEFPYKGEGVLLGFDRVFPGGPSGIYLKLANQMRNSGRKVIFEYSTDQGFCPLRAADSTRGLTQSGILRFTLPPDAAGMDIEGRNCFWIRITDEGEKSGRHVPPQLLDISVNAVEAKNLYPTDEREYTLERQVPNLTEELAGTSVVSASVWVNEISSITEDQKSLLLEKSPRDVQISYDIQGRETEFFVKWKETESFDQIPADGRYYTLDQKENRLRFGDGRHGLIPGETAGTAFKVKTLVCDGQRGNVEKGLITEPVRAYSFLKRVCNPEGAFGGSGQESEEELMKRGRTVLSSGAKVVSDADLLRETESFSRQIRQAAFHRDAGGQLNLTVLMEETGREHFALLKEDLKEHLSMRFPLSHSKGQLMIREPVFIKVSVSVWIHADGETFFREEKPLLQALEAYFGSGEGGGRGWKIGRLPEKKEVERSLYQASGNTVIRCVQIILSYQDESGMHETALEDMHPIPDAVCAGGMHRISTFPVHLRKGIKNDRRTQGKGSV